MRINVNLGGGVAQLIECRASNRKRSLGSTLDAVARPVFLGKTLNMLFSTFGSSSLPAVVAQRPA